MDELLDRQEELQNVIENARRAIEQAKTRARPTGEKERELKGAQARLSVLLRSPAHRRGMARVTIAMSQLPELVLRSFCSRFPGHVLWSASCGLQLCFPYLIDSIFSTVCVCRFPFLDPFFGSDAQGVPQVDFLVYEDVEPLFADGSGAGRHEMLQAFWLDDTNTKRRCVLKGFEHGEEKRLRTELCVLARLRHPNLLQLDAVCKRQDPLRYLVQVPWHPFNLKQKLGEPTATAESRQELLWGLMRGLLEGLLYLHEAGIVHRDLKPDNVLVSAEGHSVLSDFETSKAEGPHRDFETVTRVVISGVYTAPEVLKPGGEHSRSSDMYAFGVVLAQALACDFSARPETLLARVGVAERALLKELLHENSSKRPTARQLLQHSLFRESPQIRTCCICMEDGIPLSNGLECGRGQHFTCRACLERHVMEFSKSDMRTLQKTDAKLRCPKAPTECKVVFSDAEIASAVPAAAFDTFAQCRIRLIEVSLSAEMERQKNAEVQRELERLLKMDEQQRRVHAKSREVFELLTDACPRCKQAFVDFNGCCALSCSRCPCNFCAWCLKDCGADAHAHVANCPHNLAPGSCVFVCVCVSSMHPREYVHIRTQFVCN